MINFDWWKWFGQVVFVGPLPPVPMPDYQNKDSETPSSNVFALAQYSGSISKQMKFRPISLQALAVEKLPAKVSKITPPPLATFLNHQAQNVDWLFGWVIR